MSDHAFERRVRAALAAPVATSPDARERIMRLVRASARQGMPSRAPLALSRTGRHSVIGVAMAAGIGSIATVAGMVPAEPAGVSAHVERVLHDTLHLAVTRSWTAAVAMREGVRHYAVVVDATRWTASRSAERVRAADERVLAVLGRAGH